LAIPFPGIGQTLPIFQPIGRPLIIFGLRKALIRKRVKKTGFFPLTRKAPDLDFWEGVNFGGRGRQNPGFLPPNQGRLKGLSLGKGLGTQFFRFFNKKGVVRSSNNTQKRVG